LAARRKELGVDVKTITNALGFTRNYWSAVENDRTLIAEDKLRLLFDVLHFDDEDQSELLSLREDSRKKGWWDEYPSLSEWYKRFLGMEAGATVIRSYSGHLVPGILQIDAYAQSIFESDPSFSPIEVDRVAAVRRDRRQRLFDTDPPDIQVLISEAVLRQQVAGPEVQVEQLQSVVDLAQSPQKLLTLRVLPFRVNPGAIVNSTTLLFLGYPSPHLPTTAWQEGVRLLGSVEEEDDGFRHLDLAWQDAAARALDAEASIRAVQSVIEELSPTR